MINIAEFHCFVEVIQVNVNVNGWSLKNANIDYGVPQGSVYILYSSSICVNM